MSKAATEQLLLGGVGRRGLPLAATRRHETQYLCAVSANQCTMTVTGIVGLPGSGKSEAAAVARDIGVPVVTMGDVIREECRDRGLDPAISHGAVAQALRDERGAGAVAERSLPLIEDALADADSVLVDGIRSGVEAEIFADTFGDSFRLVCIEAPFETRQERLDLRGRDNGTETLSERDQRELAFGMDGAIEQAAVTVENTGSLEQFHSQIQRLLTTGAKTSESTQPPEHSNT